MPLLALLQFAADPDRQGPQHRGAGAIQGIATGFTATALGLAGAWACGATALAAWRQASLMLASMSG